ncbi:MAG: hypothetical protein L6R35_003324 [Caloplaca aegaea]|nr:MAG: hypothetical protein L6R35_003324 [Caloplaca aegaea]
MDKIKGVAKEGWHPKDRSIKQMLGREKDPNPQAKDHVSRPLATLKDPGAFGPPPKNVNYHGGAAVPNAITPDRRGLGAPLSAHEIRAKEEAERRESQAMEEAARKPAPPPAPYRVDTSGLTTSNLPKPPVRHLGAGDQSPISIATPSTKPKPSLPPRLPPRQASAPIADSPSPPPPPPYSAISNNDPLQAGNINQGTIRRLESAGVSVPGFGIGNNLRPERGTEPTSTSTASAQRHGTANTQLSEMQSRVSKISTEAQDSGWPDQGTTMAEKQAAVKTAQSFRNDPSSVSVSDARDTAAVANNFRERHGDQVNTGWRSVNAFNKKHDIANRINTFSTQGSTSSTAGVSQDPSSSMTSPPSVASPIQKRPPPPPPQKPSFSGGSATSPPPVPFSSKPRT